MKHTSKFYDRIETFEQKVVANKSKKQTPSHQILMFEDFDQAQSKINELEATGKEIINSYQNPFNKKYIIHFI